MQYLTPDTGTPDTLEYFLGDAFGSVRQLTDAQGQITLAKAYNPYGEVTQSVGTGQSGYGYTNEYQEGYNQLVYLRARHYAPSMGRFLSRDTWAGDYNRPMSYNRWMFGYGNPNTWTDPSGMSPECFAVAGSDDYLKCERIIRGFNPRSGPSVTELELFEELELLDFGENCITKQFSSFLGYMELPPPSRRDYEDYSYWFHYLLNQKSIREGKGKVGIEMALAIVASNEADVGSLYSKVSQLIANAMILKGRARGMYVAMGSRQATIKNVESGIIFMGQLAISGRNWDFCNRGAGVGNCYDSFEQLIDAYNPLTLEYQDMPGKIAFAFAAYPSKPSNPNNVPDDWITYITQPPVLGLVK